MHSLFVYDPLSGKLYRRSTGNPVRTPPVNRYARVHVGNSDYSVHRIAWCLYHGTQPTMIDHVNGDKTDNRLCNLRICTARENMQNRKEHRAGHLVGVSFRKESNRWRARIVVDGVKVPLGSYSSEKEANAAYVSALNSIEDYRGYTVHEKKTRTPVGITQTSSSPKLWRVRKTVKDIPYYIGRFVSLHEAEEALARFNVEMESMGVLRG